LSTNAADSAFINNSEDTTLYIGNVRAANIASIVSAGDIFNYNADSVVKSNYIQLDSSKAINVNTDSTTSVYATANDDISLNEVLGDMNVNLVQSANGNVAISSAGSILDFNNNPAIDVKGNKITLISKNGQIGSAGNDFDVDSNGIIQAQAKNNIYLREVNGDMNIYDVKSTSGNVKLASDDSILNGRNDQNANITAYDIDLISEHGSIGDSSKKLHVNASNKLNMNADSGIYLTDSLGDLISDEIITKKGSIDLYMSNGNAKIKHISAPENIGIKVEGDYINIETIDPKKLTLTVNKNGGSINIDNGFVSDEIQLIADNINGTFTDTTLSNALTLSLTGNDGNMADNVNLNIDTSDFKVSKYDASSSTIKSKTDILNWEQVRVGSKMEITTPKRTMVAHNILGYLDETKDVEIYESTWFNLFANLDKVTTDAYVINANRDQKVNLLTNINRISDTAIRTDNDSSTHAQENISEALSPLDMRTQISNKRNTIRYKVNNNAIAYVKDMDKVDIQVIDISSGGAGISTSNDIPLGQEISLNLNFKGLKVNAKTKIVSKRFDEKTGKYNIGLKFTEIDEETARNIPYECMKISSL